MIENLSNRKCLKIFQVDAFTKEPFKGNPAAVCLLDHPVEPAVMQLIAREMNLSETAFILPTSEKSWKESEEFLLRWFTPELEVPLCGHATLASSKVLFDCIGINTEVITYTTASGKLACKREADGFVLNFPLDEVVPANPSTELLKAVGTSHFVKAVYGRHTKKLILHIESEAELAGLYPDFENMKKLTFEKLVNGIAVTTAGQGGMDFVSRYFNPWAGVNEDPVTGSVHTVLAAYWGDLLGKKEMTAFQRSHRGGEIALKITENGRLELKGDAVIVLQGELYL